MNDQRLENSIYEKVDRKIIRSPLLLVTVIVFAIGAILSLLSLVKLLDPSHRREILNGLVAQNIVDGSALQTWFFFVVIAKTLFALYAVTFTLGLGMMLISSYRKEGNGSLRGLSVIGRGSLWSVYVWYALCAVAGVVFVVKFIRYTVTLVSEVQEFLFPLIAMVTGEIVMLLVAAVLVSLIIKILKEISDLAYQSYYMLRTGRAESHIDPLSYVAFFAIAVLCGYIAYFLSYDILAIICFSMLALASLLMGICIRFFKKEVEWIKYRNYKKKK